MWGIGIWGCAVAAFITSAARTTGLLYLGLPLTGVLGSILVRGQLYVVDDPRGTLSNLVEHTSMARLGIVLELGIVLTQAAAAVWFYRRFRGVDTFAAGLVAGFGMVNAVAILGSAAVPRRRPLLARSGRLASQRWSFASDLAAEAVEQCGLSGGVWTMSSTTSYSPRIQGDSRSGSGLREHSAAATTAGILFIIGTVAGILSKVITSFPVHNADDPLAYAADHSGAVATGALLVLVMGLSLALIPVVLFPVLRRVDEVLATGYLIIRGAVEAATYVIVAIAWLLLVPLADTMSAGPGTASPAGVRLGILVIDSDGASVIMSLVFCLGAALFYVLLFRSRIVPRWIASWGLMGIPLYAAAYLLVMYGVVGIDSSVVNLLCLPLAVQEMVLAVWMIARGFRPAAVSSTLEV